MTSRVHTRCMSTLSVGTQHGNAVVFFCFFFTFICLTFLSFIVFPVRQDWEGKADEAKKDYERAMKEFRESSGGTSKKYFTQSVHKNLTVQVSFLK